MKRLHFDDWIKEIEIVIDTREKKINHIIKVLDDMGVKYVFEKLNYGDYSYRFQGVYSLKGFIERKNSLDEISVNFTKNRERFRREWERVPRVVCKYLFIEGNTLDDIIIGNYATNINPISFLASFLAFEEKYKIKTSFVKKENFTILMLRTFYYNFYYNGISKAYML